MKTISGALSAHLASEATTLATCWKVTRIDGTQFFFTDHDKDLSVSSNTYLASSAYTRTAVANNTSLSVDNLDVQGVFDDASISVTDLRAGLFDFAEVEMFLVNWDDLSQGTLILRRGRLGEVTLSTQGLFKAELRGMSQALSQDIGELYQPECRADLGDSRCKVPIAPTEVTRSSSYSLGDFVVVDTAGGASYARYANRIYECTTAGTTSSSAPTYSTTPGATTTDGSAVFTAYQAWARSAVVDTVSSNRVFTFTAGFDESRAVDGWFNGGALKFDSGNNDGVACEVKNWTQSTRTVELFLPTPLNVVPGDTLFIYAGCDKRLSTCQSKFAMSGSLYFPTSRGNVWNYRGEPHVPGQDVLSSYPDAHSS